MLGLRGQRRRWQRGGAGQGATALGVARSMGEVLFKEQGSISFLIGIVTMPLYL